MNTKKIMLICSDGGHLAQVLELETLFINYNYVIVTEESDSTRSLAKKYNVKYLKHRPSGQGRSIKFWWIMFLNLFLSVKYLLVSFPRVIITTGSHTAVPMCLLGKLLFVKIVWILSYARITSKAKSASFIYPIANKFIVQWPGMQLHYPKAVYLGGIY